MLAMLLCQWAVSPSRSGFHRPLVAARVLRQRQDQIIMVRNMVGWFDLTREGEGVKSVLGRGQSLTLLGKGGVTFSGDSNPVRNPD